MYKEKEMLSMPITRTANGIMLVVVIKLATFPNNSLTKFQLRAHLFKQVDGNNSRYIIVYIPMEENCV